MNYFVLLTKNKKMTNLKQMMDNVESVVAKMSKINEFIECKQLKLIGIYLKFNIIQQ